MEDARDQLARELLACSYAELTEIQRCVIDLIATEQPHELPPPLRPDTRSFGQRLADRVAAVGGSWAFIIGFTIVLVAWMSWNVLVRAAAFDPFPFIFLNLMLSMLAAIQAPVIMMSQNRADERDRLAAEHDHLVNLRAALEIMRLRRKIESLSPCQLTCACALSADRSSEPPSPTP